MPKRTKYVVLSKEQVKTAILAHTDFGQGTVDFVINENKVVGCVVIKNLSQTAHNNVYEIVSFSRKEIDDLLISLNKQEHTDGGVTIQYQQQGLIDPNAATGEHLFDMVVIRYGADIQFDTRILSPINEEPSSCCSSCTCCTEEESNPT